MDTFYGCIKGAPYVSDLETSVMLERSRGESHAPHSGGGFLERIFVMYVKEYVDIITGLSDEKLRYRLG